MRTKPTTRHGHQTQPPIYRNLFNTVNILRSMRRFSDQPGKATFFLPRENPYRYFHLPPSLALFTSFLLFFMQVPLKPVAHIDVSVRLSVLWFGPLFWAPTSWYTCWLCGGRDRRSMKRSQTSFIPCDQIFIIHWTLTMDWDSTDCLFKKNSTLTSLTSESRREKFSFWK